MSCLSRKICKTSGMGPPIPEHKSKIVDDPDFLKTFASKSAQSKQLFLSDSATLCLSGYSFEEFKNPS